MTERPQSPNRKESQRKPPARPAHVSIVLPTFKRSLFLERSIRSVFAQTYRDWELIVVDDNDPSSPHRHETQEFMRRYADDPRVIYLCHEENRGGAAARNTGIRAAVGEYVAFLDDDDEWAPDKLEKQVACMERTDGLDMVYCGYRKVYVETGREMVELPDARRHTFRRLLKENGIGTTSTVLCRRATLFEVGMFDESLASRQDADLYVRLARQGRFGFVREPLVTWYRHLDEAIGKNRSKSITAHRIFLEKYRSDLERHPHAYAYRLLRYGLLLLQAGRLAQARSVLWDAWLKSPVSLPALWYCLLANRVGFDIYWRLLRLKRRCRLNSAGVRKAVS